MSKTRYINTNIIEFPADRVIDKIPSPFLTRCSPYVTQTFNSKLDISLNNIADSTMMSKIIVIGDVSVGKTCLVNRFCKKIFDGNYKATIGVDFEVENFLILNVPFALQIWDTAGQERFKSIAQSYYRGANAVVIVFDLTKPDTLHNCHTWLMEASQTFSAKPPYLFVVGTKRDLVKTYAYMNIEECAIRVATKLNAEYWAISSKTGKNVDNLFRRIAALTFQECVRRDLEGKRFKEIGNNIVALQPKTTLKRGNCVAKCKN
ncbi:ras-related protein Rab-34 [Diabrotica undecimpunctata]|uniref:ras-related protein Rab-34 n=1 Tax=Diabrotica undecimpunctata TaxID=50387 RepID=UPI003B635DFD